MFTASRIYLDPPPATPPEAQTDAEKIAYCAGWWAALEMLRKTEIEALRAEVARLRAVIEDDGK